MQSFQNTTRKRSLWSRLVGLTTITERMIPNADERRIAEMLTSILLGGIGSVLLSASVLNSFSKLQAMLPTINIIFILVFTVYSGALILVRQGKTKVGALIILFTCIASTTYPSTEYANFWTTSLTANQAIHGVLFSPIAIYFAAFVFGMRGTLITAGFLDLVQLPFLGFHSSIPAETLAMLGLMNAISAASLVIFVKMNARHLKQIQEQQAAIASAAKMSSLGEMAGSVGHEINNPLAVILARANQVGRLLNRDVPRVGEAIEFAKSIENMGNRIATIVRGLKTFSRNAEADPPEPCNLQKIIDDTLILCEQKLRLGGIQLTIGDEVKELWVDARPVQLSQVLLNLLNNSSDAIENFSEKWIRIDGLVNGNTIQFSVTDSGPGIPEDIRKRLMEPFYTTKPVGKGTGLGLSVSRAIIASHNGRLEIDETCANTRFIIELPATPTKGGTAHVA